MSNLIEFEDLRTICRICLNKNQVLILLTNYLNGFNKTEGPLIKDVLADIMSTKINNDHPRAICLQCLDQLKSAYNLKLQFNKSQEKLQTYEEAIIASYIKDEHFEVCMETKYEPENCLEIISCTDNTFGTIKENSDTVHLNVLSDTASDTEETTESLNYKFKTKRMFTEYSEKPMTKSKIPLKITNVVRHIPNKDRDIQVRCIDTNKFIIEKKDSSNNLYHQHNLTPNRSVILGEKSTFTKIKLVKVKCVSCGRYFSGQKYKIHAIHCQKLPRSALTCKECCKVFKRVKDLNCHVKLKHRINLFPCKICDLKFVNYSARRRHMLKNHGGGKSFICEICNKAFFYNASLLKHKSKHTRETQEVCNICGKSFHYKGALFYHIKMHTNERKYLCNFCERRFYTSQALQRHLDTHTGDRRFKCQYCDKCFRSTSERRRHEMIHTGEKPYQCDYCDKRFTSKYNHDIHTAAHRGQLPCAICSGTYLNAEVLQLHLKLKHKVKLETLSIQENVT